MTVTGIHIENEVWKANFSSTNRVYTRVGTNTPSDEYDSYREYRVANTNMYSECVSEEEVKNVYSANTCGLHYT